MKKITIKERKMKNYTLHFKWFVPVMIKLDEYRKWQPHKFYCMDYTITDPRWTDIWNIFQFDIYLDDYYYATYKMDYTDLEIAVGADGLTGFEIKKFKTSLPIPERYSRQFEPKKITNKVKK